MRSPTKLALALTLLGLVVSGTSAQTHGEVTFDNGSFGWSWGGVEWIEPAGGNPGAYLHAEVCCSYYPIAFNESSYTGDYRYAGLATLGIDLIIPNGSSRPVTLLLRTDSDTPETSDDFGAYTLAHVAPLVGDDWQSVDVLIPAQEDELPPGWSLWNATDQSWSELIQDVDGVWFILGDLDQYYFESHWVVGMDNARFSKGEPGRVPPDLVMDKIALGWVKLFWNAPGGCGQPDDFAIYEGAIGDWDSHVPVTCSDTQDPLEERILTTPGDRYYLVVPLGSETEGSYGRDSNDAERPPGALDTCRESVSLTCS